MENLKAKPVIRCLLIFVLLLSASTQTITFAEAIPETWDIVDEGFSDYKSGWGVSKGSSTNAATGSIVQGDGIVTIKESLEATNFAWHFLIKNDFTIPEGAFTFEFKAKVNNPSTGNEVGVRLNNKLVGVFLSYDGEAGTIRDRVVNPTQTHTLDTSEYNIYRVVVNNDYSFDVYVNGQYLISSQAGNESGGKLIKIGAESIASADMDIDYFKMANGILVPEGQEPTLETSDLETAIAKAKALVEEASVGENLGQYPQSAVDTLQAAIIEAEALLLNESAEQSQINDMVVKLEQSISLFNNSIHVAPATFPVFEYQKVVIDPANMNYNPTDEYDFPTVIRASDYFEKPLGKYYMYYGPHDSPGGISLAYSDSPEGPWVEYEANPVINRNNPPHYSVSHVASAHPIWMEEENKLYMYFHGENTTTRLATSVDGIHFYYEKTVVTTADFNDVSETSYARVFKYTIPEKGNKYIMLLMGNNNGNRRIYLAWSNDGKEWETQRTPVISPVKTESFDHKGNLSGAYYFPWEGRHYVAVHAGDGHQYIVEVGENFDLAIHHGAFNKATGEDPDYGRVASRSYLQEGDTVYMYYEVGQRGSTKIALAKSVPPEELEKLKTVDINIQNTTLQKGTSTPLVMNAIRKNGKPVDLNDVTINYFSSNPNVVTVKDGIVQAHAEGTAEIWVEAAFNDVTVASNTLILEVRDGFVWDIVDESFRDYTKEWGITKGSRTSETTGKVTQGDGYVTIVETLNEGTSAFRYVTKNNFFVPHGAYTFEFRAKVNALTTGNEVGVRVNGQLMSVFLTNDGVTGSVQNKIQNPTQTFTLDTTVYHVYRVVVNENSTFDLYVDGEYIWTGESVVQSNGNLIKLGADTPATANMDVDYFKMNTGILIPEVNVDIPYVRSLLEEYGSKGEVQQPLATQLENHLNNAEHHFGDGRIPQAIHQMETFIRHLNNSGLSNLISAHAKEELTEKATKLIDKWYNE
ncbi:FIMAH domain-containing protein [Neobacillus niacini]|uniref:FIMAH domain-containing protein n=1 Tax=Neobacillus niacini TaxID=86668 RepID=UPI001C8DBF2F|nr:hypothetical protein [Neobacillus niacini]MBY0149104.1 hypothetical protein [Neobacillus niacini]